MVEGEAGRKSARVELDLDALAVDLAPADPKAYTHPFTVTLNEYLEPAAELTDFVCLENDASGPQFLGK